MHQAPPQSRVTRQRVEVLSLLEDIDDFRTAQQLYLMLVQRGARVGLTTVYRTLQRLVDAGEVDATRLPGGEQLYRQCSRSHHYHLVCRVCGKTIEVKGQSVRRWATRVGDQHGFTDVEHALEVFGTCSTCSR